jgi:hypothetical protein
VPKWLPYGVLAVADLVAAYLFYADGGFVLPVILVLAGLCFTAAAVGAAMGKG